jgi:hypothetical protein
MFSHELYNSVISQIGDTPIDGGVYLPLDTFSDVDFNSIIFPVAMKIAAQTIGLNLISVQPMEHGVDYEKIKRERVREQRKKKIEEIFPEMKKHEK